MQNEIVIQQENISNLLLLIKENPDLPIMPMVETEVVGGDDFGYWSARWGKASVREYWADEENDGRIYYRDSDYNSLVDKFMDDKEIEFKLDPLAYDIEEFAKNIIDKLDWTKAIIVKIDSIW